MRGLPLVVLGIIGLIMALPAAGVEIKGPAADKAPFIKDRKSKGQAADKLQATYIPKAIKLPAKPWKIPEAIIDLTGHGISLYYLIPYKRVQGIIPKELKPYPSKKKIWFRVDIIQWTSVRPRSRPGKKLKKFIELAYRFEVLKNGKRGTFPLRIYLDTPWTVLWTRHYGKYDSYPTPRADVNFSPFMHFFQLRRGKLAILVVDAFPRQGLSAQMTDLFDRHRDSVLWLGADQEYIMADTSGHWGSVVRRFEGEIKSAELRNLLLPEPVRWQILDVDEVNAPDKVLSLESITGTWIGEAGPPERQTDRRKQE